MSANQKSTTEKVRRSPPGKATPLAIDGRARAVTRIVLAGILLLLSLWIAQDFLAPLGWAVVIAITSWPIYSWFSARMGDRWSTAAPLLFTLVTSFLLFLPIMLTLHQLAQDGQALAQSLNHFRQNGIPVPAWLPSFPVVGQTVSRWWSVNFADATAAAEWLGRPDAKNDVAVTRAVGSELLHRSFLFFVAMIALFFLLRDGPWLANRMLDTADRLLGDPGERLAHRMADAVRGTVNGTIVVAVLEGAIIGVAYFVAGVPNPMLFTLLTMAFAMLPLGAWVVFFTASLLLVLQGGSVWAASGVFGFGAVIMLVGDTFVWPTLVGNVARLPFLVALIGIFGGLQAFGLIGLFLGPVILAAFLTVWREWFLPRTSQ